jgi:acyl-CoA synthetase (AMP-forming)/AMP-acid ligase II/acyl carrier protein
VKALICGGEPVRQATCDAFERVFGERGLAAGAICPHYGLSEVGSIATKKVGAPARNLRLSSKGLREGRVLPGDATEGRTVASCGPLTAEIEIRIVDPHTSRLCPADRIGEIWVRSAAVASGYLGQEAIDRFNVVLEQEGAGFLRTGDLGFVSQSELFVVGREKELIVVRGKNHYPIDIEATARSAAAELAGPEIVFSCGEDEARERVVLLKEVPSSLSTQDARAHSDRIMSSVIAQHGIALDEICFVRNGVLPRSGTGKLLRRDARSAYEGGGIEATHRFARASPSRSLREADPRADTEARLRSEVLGPEVGLPRELVERVDRLSELGLDSVRYPRVAKRIEEVFGVVFDAVGLFRFSSVGELAAYIADQTCRTGEATLARPRNEPIAIVGLECRMPRRC